jgi:Ca-activated chloride channel family protein
MYLHGNVSSLPVKSTKALLLFFACCCCSVASAQYYIRGEVRDEQNHLLQAVNIFQYSNHLLFKSGSGGSFGLPSTQLYDSLLFYMDGYEPVSVRVKTTQWVSVVMKSYGLASSSRKNKMISLTKDLPKETKRSWFYGNESYQTLIENDFVNTRQYPLTSLVLDVDKASYPNIRRFIKDNSIVPPDAVRIEEMLNYFDFGYQKPDEKKIFSAGSKLAVCPWDSSSRLMYMQISARKADMDKIPPSNLVFLIDISGSMDLPNRLPLLKSAFKLLVTNLREKDSVSIVVYGGYVAIKLDITSGAEKQKINAIPRVRMPCVPLMK